MNNGYSNLVWEQGKAWNQIKIFVSDSQDLYPKLNVVSDLCAKEKQGDIVNILVNILAVQSSSNFPLPALGYDVGGI